MRRNYSILLVHNYYQHAGGEDIVVEREKKMLENHEHKVFLYVRHNEELNSVLGKIKFLFSFLYSYKSYKEIKEIIEREKIDIVHVHNTFPLITASVYRAAHDAGALVIQTLHNFRFICPGALFLREGKVCEECSRSGFGMAIRHKCYRNSKIQTIMEVFALSYCRKKRLYEKIDAYIALTEFNKRKFERDFPWCKGKIYVKPNFISESSDCISEISEKARRYIYIGRLSEEKGIEVLLKAFSRLPNQMLEIVGSGPLEAFVREYIEKKHLQNVNLLGQLSRDDLMCELSASKALILPSIWYEGFPMVIVEAFSCGIPVIGSNLGNVAFAIDDKKNGLLFQTGNAEDLAEKVTFLDTHSELYSDLRKGVMQKYRQNYTEEINYRCLLDIYEIASKKPLDTVGKS